MLLNVFGTMENSTEKESERYFSHLALLCVELSEMQPTLLGGITEDLSGGVPSGAGVIRFVAIKCL